MKLPLISAAVLAYTLLATMWICYSSAVAPYWQAKLPIGWWSTLPAWVLEGFRALRTRRRRQDVEI